MFDQLIHRYLRIPYRLNMSVVKKGKRPRHTLLFIHGIGNSGRAWDEVIKQLPENTRAVTVDLLGFGKSRQPSWAVYNASFQARAVFRTCLRYGIDSSKLIIIGHSMGSLVAIELARRYPLFAKSLILCSPPLYQPEDSSKLPGAEKLLRKLYRAIHDSPQQFLKLSKVAVKYGLVSRAFEVTDKNIDSYMNALEAAVINQSSLEDISKLTIPIHIIRGTLDPVLVPKRIKQLDKERDNITVSTIVSGHEVRGRFVTKVVEVIERLSGNSR